jgi:hypothetical protein
MQDAIYQWYVGQAAPAGTGSGRGKWNDFNNNQLINMLPYATLNPNKGVYGPNDPGAANSGQTMDQILASLGISGGLASLAAGGGGGASGMDPLSYELQNRQLTNQERQWLQQFNQSNDQWNQQYQQSQEAARAQAAQWLQQYQSGEDQRKTQNNLAQGQFDWSRNTWGKEFDRASTNDSWARSSDQFNQAMTAATNEWQKKNAADQLKVQSEGNALAAWGRRSNPLISAM